MLRARQAAEDNAAMQVAQARRELSEAERASDEQRARLDALSLPEHGSIHTFLHGIAKGSAAAATHAAAQHRVGFAKGRLDTSMGQLNLAAQQRKSVQKLSERIAAEAHATELISAQRILDDVTTSRFTRAAEAGRS